MALPDSLWTPTGAPSPQFVQVVHEGSVLRARLIGPAVKQRDAEVIDHEVTRALRRADPRTRTFVLDLSAVQTLSSIGLGMCISVRNTAHQEKMRTIVTGLNRELRELFKMMRVDRLFTYAHDEDELRALLK